MKFNETDYGKFLPAHLERKREEDAEKRLAKRQALWRIAINEACLSSKRETLARALYHDQGISLEDWPSLAPLEPQERTLLIREVRKIFGLRPAKADRL